MKVWGGNTNDWKRCGDHTGQVRTIVAAPNQREAARLVGTSLHEFRGYWSETGNKVEVATAMSQPGVVFKASTSMEKDFEPALTEGKQS